MLKRSRAALLSSAIVFAVIAVAVIFRDPRVVGKFIEDNEAVIETISTLAVAIFTFTLWTATRKLGELALDQGEAMERSISEAAKATQATAQIAAVAKENATLMQSLMHKQMRAYVSVDAGQATFQDGALRFAAIPVITNTGFTPARKLSFHAMAAVLDTNLRDDHRFEEFGSKNVADATLSPRQSYTFNSVIRERFPDNEVRSIMSGEARRLYVWGTITYEDVFGGSWETRFCFNYIFYRDGENVVRVNSYIYRRHNSAT
ncbi:MAG: hypothetical protein ACTHMK_14175 [Dyella sp.]|uniref:hypothetical protein n=1 Tax=Dyella sp. TaxID=1869338 RepID=UPI003F821387